MQLSGGLNLSPGFLFQSPEGVVVGNARGWWGKLVGSRAMRSGVAVVSRQGLGTSGTGLGLIRAIV